MSIDKYHFTATNGDYSEVAPPEWMARYAHLGEGTHTIYVMWGGVEHLFIFEEGATAAEAFERWRRQPCGRIVLTLDGLEQVGDRLPVNSVPETGCDVDVSWDGDFDTDGDPNGPARWKVRCGQPVAGTVAGRDFCQKHLGERQ